MSAHLRSRHTQSLHQYTEHRACPFGGTDFGPPLTMALEKLNAEQTTISQQKAKIVLFISDGEDFGEETNQAAKAIVDSGVQLFALGVGTERGSK